MENLTKIAERLNEFKDEANLTAKALAKELGFSRVKIGRASCRERVLLIV